MDIKFGYTDNALELRGEKTLEKRDTSLLGKFNGFLDRGASSLLAEAAPLATATPSSKVRKDVDHQLIDVPLIPPDVSQIALLDDLPMPSSYLPKCRNCSTTGSFDIIHGSLSIKAGSGSLDNLVHSLDSGSFTLQANNLGAHIDLSSSIPASTSLDLHTISLPEIPLTPFQIPGIAAVGPIFKPSIVFGAKTTEQLDFSYCFDAIVPKEASITLDPANLGKSSPKGFSEARIDALPFHTNASDMDLELSISFRPNLF